MIRQYLNRLAELAPELEAAEHKRAHIIDYMRHAPIICFIKEARTGKYEFVNEMALKEMNKNEFEVLGRTDWEVFTEEQAKIARAHDNQILSVNEESLVSIEFRSFDGSKEKLYLVSRFLIKNGNTSIGGFAIEIPETFKLEPLEKRV